MFTPLLNVRTSYNFLESFITIDKYLSFAKKHNFKYVFYNDNLSMFGAMEFYHKAKKAGIKPIIGLTIEMNELDLIFYAKDELGFKNLNYLSTYLMDQKSVDDTNIKEILFQHKLNNLVLVLNEKTPSNYDDVLSIINKQIDFSDIYISTATNPNFYAKKVSYFNVEDFKNFITLIAIKKSIKTSEMQVLSGLDIQPAPFVSKEEISKELNIEEHKIIISQIAEKCNLEIEKKPMNLIRYKTPNNIPADKFLKMLCEDSLIKYFENIKKTPVEKKYLERLNYELEIINQMGFSNYFLVVWDYVRFAKISNIMVGPGRGSAAGSIVSFLLQITQVDPMQYNLLFERFLNPERISMPDIDIDFQDDRREEVLEYLFEKYGKFNVATITTYQTILVKSAIRDVCRAEGIDLAKVNRITKGLSFEQAYDIEKAMNVNKELREFLYDPINENIKSTIIKMIGIPRQTGTHAAGVIITNSDLRESVPLKVGYNGIYQSQFDMNYLEDLGLIKMDILGLRNLTTLQEIKTLIKRKNQEFDFLKLPLYNKKTFELLQQKNTSGIFQLESFGMTKVVGDMKVNSIEDISAASALYRPGPQEMIPEYISRKNSIINIDKYLIDPKLKDILSPTYGIIVYQEQVIQILKRVASFSLSKADIVRRAMGKKDMHYMESVKIEFIQNAIQNGYVKDKAIKIWEWIEKFASYGFNKSHSIAYSYISYWLAYAKANYTEDFYCALLNSSSDSSIKVNQYLKELMSFGLTIRMPSIKNLNYKYLNKNKIVYIPLTSIKGIGKEFIEKFRKIHDEDPKFNNSLFSLLLAFKKYGISNSYYDALVYSGALDVYGYSRATLIAEKEMLLEYANFEKNNDSSFGHEKPILDEVNEFDNLYDYEMEYLGFSMKQNPMQILRNEYRILKLKSISDFIKTSNIGNILFCIDEIKTIKDKNNKTMAFIMVKDDSQSIEATVFSKDWENLRFDLIENINVVCEVKKDSFAGKDKLIINKLIRKIR